MDPAIQQTLRKAIKDGKLADVVRLLSSTPSLICIQTTFGTWLHMAASHGQMDIARWLLANGADVNEVGGVGDRRAIDEAAANGHCDIVNLMIEAGSVLDTSRSDRNPLFATIVGGATEGHNAVARTLIFSGLDFSVRYANLSGMDAAEYAKQWGREEIVRLLEGLRSA